MPHARISRAFLPALGLPLAALLLAGAGQPARAETFVENAMEFRFQLDFHVPDAALKPLIPAGFESNVATQGAAKDANLRLIFIDRIDITGADGRPIGKGSNRLVWLTLPVRNVATNTNVQMVLGGLTEDATDAPGPFGVYLPATVHKMRRATSVGDGPAMQGEEDWDFSAASGEHYEVHVKYERGPANRGSSETRFYSAANPTFFQVSKNDQGLDIMKNVITTPPDRVASFSYKVSGGRFAKLFDGTETVLSWDAIPYLSRSISLP